MLYEALRESWAFKEIWQEGEEKGLEKGRQEGLKKGLQEGQLVTLRKTVLTLIDKRFPSLLYLAQGIVPDMSDPVALEQVKGGKC
ncbi:MAG: hypothetical protein M3Z08_16190 [Chloroflexota bacterium]|nr:hypothetical protein [Chloroflexota bacterium]